MSTKREPGTPQVEAMSGQLLGSGRCWRAIVVSGEGAQDGNCLGVSEEGLNIRVARAPRSDEVVAVTLLVPGAGELVGSARLSGAVQPRCFALRWTACSMRLAWFLAALRRAGRRAGQRLAGFGRPQTPGPIP